MMPTVELPSPAPVRHETIRAACVEDVRGLVALRAHWNTLLASSATANPFLTWEWLHAWWQHLRGTSALRTIAVWAGDELIALAPLMATRGVFGRLRCLEFLGTGLAGSDYLDLIVRRGRETEGVRALARHIEQQQLPLRLDHVAEPSLATRLADRLRDEGWTWSTVADGVCPVIALAGHSWESYLGTLGPAHRANVRRRVRALGRDFWMRFEQVGTESERLEALSALRGFHESRFRSHGGSTAFLTPSLTAFQNEATRGALERGWLRMYVLRLDGEVAAVMYGFAYNGRFYFYQHGFDDRFQGYSIGLALMSLTIRAALDEGLHTFDLLWGAESYKRLWAHQARSLRRIHLFPADIGGRLRQGALEARRLLVPLARRMLMIGDPRAV